MQFQLERDGGCAALRNLLGWPIKMGECEVFLWSDPGQPAAHDGTLVIAQGEMYAASPEDHHSLPRSPVAEAVGPSPVYGCALGEVRRLHPANGDFALPAAAVNPSPTPSAALTWGRVKTVFK